MTRDLECSINRHQPITHHLLKKEPLRISFLVLIIINACKNENSNRLTQMLKHSIHSYSFWVRFLVKIDNDLLEWQCAVLR